MDHVIPILRTDQDNNRQQRVYFMNKWTAKLMESLENNEQDAMMEIGITAHLLAGKAGYRMCLYGELPGTKHEDFAARFIELRRRFREWSRELTRQQPEALGVCVAICTEEASVYSLEKSKGMRSVKIKHLLKEGLGLWIKIAGWK